MKLYFILSPFAGSHLSLPMQFDLLERLVLEIELELKLYFGAALIVIVTHKHCTFKHRTTNERVNIL